MNWLNPQSQMRRLSFLIWTFIAAQTQESSINVTLTFYWTCSLRHCLPLFPCAHAFFFSLCFQSFQSSLCFMRFLLSSPLSAKQHKSGLPQMGQVISYDFAHTPTSSLLRLCLTSSCPLFSLAQKYCSWISSTTTARRWHRCCWIWFRISRVS